jgi:hypothetical protein
MNRWDDRNLVLVYIYLATSVVFLGVGITFALLTICWRLGVDITRHYWLLAIPPLISVLECHVDRSLSQNRPTLGAADRIYLINSAPTYFCRTSGTFMLPSAC